MVYLQHSLFAGTFTLRDGLEIKALLIVEMNKWRDPFRFWDQSQEDLKKLFY